MAWQNNQTSGRDFLLSDLCQGPSAPRTFFALSLLELLAALLGSTTMITLIRAHPQLHSPTYFLLGQLSLMDLLYMSTFVPKMALDFLSGDRRISFFGCSIQMFLFTTLMGSGCLLLAVMAYDRYVAICHPLHCPIRMRPKVCTLLVLTSWLGALLSASNHVVYTLTLPYYASRQIHHFFCEIPALLKLVCTDTSQYEKGIFVRDLIFFLSPFSAILASYGRILFTVLGMGSSLGLRKALATCFSHMIVVSLFYGASIIRYFLPKSYHCPERHEVLSAFYTFLGRAGTYHT